MKNRCYLLGTLALTAVLAGCAAHSTNAVLPTGPQMLVPNATPPACKKQKTYSQYASDDETLSTKGGSVCIPAFAGFGGTIKYPPANPSVSLSLISSTTNYNGKLPSLHSGTPIFYLQLAIGGPTTFGQSVKTGGGLTGAAITPGDAYTAYAQAKILGFPYNFKPCYAIARMGKYGGVIGGVGSLLVGQQVPSDTSGVFEIYPGKSTNTKC